MLDNIRHKECNSTITTKITLNGPQWLFLFLGLINSRHLRLVSWERVTYVSFPFHFDFFYSQPYTHYYY